MKKLTLATLISTLPLMASAATEVVQHTTQQAKIIIAVFAHPDDETWVSGTLSKLANRGLTVTPIYVTSGDAGSDYSGRALSGEALAKVREYEAINATTELGLASPIFLRYPTVKLTDTIQKSDMI